MIICMKINRKTTEHDKKLLTKKLACFFVKLWYAEKVQKIGISDSLISFKSVLSKVVATDDKNCLYQMILRIFRSFWA